MIHQNIKDFILNAESDEEVRLDHLSLLNSGNYLRDSGSKLHFCVYFGVVDIKNKLVYLGHHKKAEQWLFNGGHLDPNETPSITVTRETQEELGITISEKNILPWSRLSITSVANSAYQPFCETHYDLWHFIHFDKESFKPDVEKISTEFYDSNWLTIDEAYRIVVNQNTKDILNYLEKKFNHA